MSQATARRGSPRRPTRAVWAPFVGLAALLLAFVGPTPASASGGGGWEYWHDVEYSEVTEDTCDVPGLTVQLDQVSDGKWRIVRARNGLPLYQEVGRYTNTYTNLANGAFVTTAETQFLAQRRVTDNGDGTNTALVRVTGRPRVHDQDGALLDAFRYRLWVELNIDNGGTPKDPDDDEVTGGRILDRRSTGDLCDSMVPALT
jgi:hypothetical protein